MFRVLKERKGKSSIKLERGERTFMTNSNIKGCGMIFIFIFIFLIKVFAVL